MVSPQNAPGAGEDDHGSASEHELPDDSPADALNDWYDVNDAFIDDSDVRQSSLPPALLWHNAHSLL